MVLNIAHRGFSGSYPENTMLAFQKALELGVDAIEIDVQLSCDGELMVFHDEELEKLTGKQGWLKDFTAHELRNMDASGRFKGIYGVNGIPTLKEFFELIRNTEVITFLELKNGIIT